MKKLVTLSLILFSLFAKAQKRSSIAVSYGTGDGVLLSLPPTKGSASYEGKTINSFGINYFEEIRKKLSLEAGIQYIKHVYAVMPSAPPFIKREGRELIFLSIPLKWRYVPEKSFFLNGGFLTDFTIKGDGDEKFYGIGLSFGGGFRFNTEKRVGFYINPQLNLRNVLGSGKQLAEANITFGTSYRIQ